jgi:hypothetical protein
VEPFEKIEHQPAMCSLYVLSSLENRPVGNWEMRSGMSDQAKNDIGKAWSRFLRVLVARQRQLGRILRKGGWIMRESDCYLRESLKEADSRLPLCSLIVLFVFLQVSFRASRWIDHH